MGSEGPESGSNSTLPSMPILRKLSRRYRQNLLLQMGLPSPLYSDRYSTEYVRSSGMEPMIVETFVRQSEIEEGGPSFPLLNTQSVGVTILIAIGQYEIFELLVEISSRNRFGVSSLDIVVER